MSSKSGVRSKEGEKEKGEGRVADKGVARRGKAMGGGGCMSRISV